MINPFLHHMQLHFSTHRDGIELAKTLYVATVTRVAAVGYHDVVEGALLGAGSRKTNAYHVVPYEIQSHRRYPPTGNSAL